MAILPHNTPSGVLATGFPTRTKGSGVSDRLRRRMEAAVTRLIEALDALDGDPDIEPYLAGFTSQSDDDRESDHEHGCSDDEPSIGASERHPDVDPAAWGPYRYIDRDRGACQTDWAAGGDTGEREVVSEDEGACIQSKPHDGDADAEPSLGWTLNGQLGSASGEDYELQDEDGGDVLDASEDLDELPFRLDQTEFTGASNMRVPA